MSKKKIYIGIVVALCLVFLSVYLILTSKRVTQSLCGWQGQIDVRIVDSVKGQGVEGIKVHLGTGVFSSNYVCETDSEGHCNNESEISWCELTTKDIWSNQETKGGPTLNLVKDDYCNDSYEMTDLDSYTFEKITIMISMKPSETENTDSPYVIHNVEIHPP